MGSSPRQDTVRSSDGARHVPSVPRSPFDPALRPTDPPRRWPVYLAFALLGALTAGSLVTSATSVVSRTSADTRAAGWRRDNAALEAELDAEKARVAEVVRERDELNATLTALTGELESLGGDPEQLAARRRRLGELVTAMAAAPEASAACTRAVAEAFNALLGANQDGTRFPEPELTRWAEKVTAVCAQASDTLALSWPALVEVSGGAPAASVEGPGDRPGPLPPVTTTTTTSPPPVDGE